MVSKGSYKGSALSPSKAPGSGSKYNSTKAGGDGRPSGSGAGKKVGSSYNKPQGISKAEVGKGRGSAGSSGPLGMFAKGPSGKVSDKKKKFKPGGPVSKSFGFGKQQSRGMKGVPTQYGSV